MSEGAIIINGDRYPLPTDPTLRELYEIKQRLDLDADDLANAAKNRKSTEAMIALVYLALHRADPSKTIDDALDASGFDIEEPTVEEEELPPTGAATRAASSSTAPSLEMIRAASGTRVS